MDCIKNQLSSKRTLRERVGTCFFADHHVVRKMLVDWVASNIEYCVPDTSRELSSGVTERIVASEQGSSDSEERRCQRHIVWEYNGKMRRIIYVFECP